MADSSKQNTDNDTQPSGLDSAPDDIKLAVDLIYLLESSELPKSTILSALEIVKNDFEKK
ncbi:DUF2496 domain-containing protein [Vibrio sp. Of7-15]|uniref:DUF2496 domain-containing protein n=1 Tax=Vibrio sp. Of7-15 TaxID=2724879 RepID=UPI001EF1CC03|nr:DUF2496 domain-containing protein [Vibrio sp. Of7-15]MCG7496979.1 DUF2496 domain-containing protein [Vibrio sp. Of7-15]